MKHSVTPFNYNGRNLSTITDEAGEIWFIAKEVAEILEYSDAHEMTSRLDADEKQNRQIAGFGNRGVTTINESGLYSAILGSTKPEAKPFKKWVTSEVLPAIRKTGGYTAQVAPKQIAPPDLFPKYFKVAKLIGCDRNLAAISANNAVYQKTGENVLKLLGHTHLETPEQQLYFNVSDLVDGVSGQRMNKMLAAAGLQTRDGDRWTPTAQGQSFSRIYDTGKRHGDGMPVQAVRWTRDVLPLLSLEAAAA